MAGDRSFVCGIWHRSGAFWGWKITFRHGYSKVAVGHREPSARRMMLTNWLIRGKIYRPGPHPTIPCTSRASITREVTFRIMRFGSFHLPDQASFEASQWHCHRIFQMLVEHRARKSWRGKTPCCTDFGTPISVVQASGMWTYGYTSSHIFGEVSETSSVSFKDWRLCLTVYGGRENWN
jgi:hypothetical protein